MVYGVTRRTPYTGAGDPMALRGLEDSFFSRDGLAA